jgi:flagellar biosynthesis/type III secretory pathway M-ring protein FliF/YscJ
VIKPALKRPPPPAGSRGAVVADDLSLPPPSGSTASLGAPGPNEDVMRLARENPATVANVVRAWVNT